MTYPQRQISIGSQRFEDLRMKNLFYVDKTDFIREWWENEDPVTLITRPRRFGKTLNMDMLRCFFSTEYANRQDLFEGLNVWRNKELRSLQGTYPVIFLTFANVKQNTYRGAVAMIKQCLTNLYSDFYFLLDQANLNTLERQQFLSIDYDMSDEVAQSSVQYLCRYLARYYGKKVIILLDEYDTPMQEAYIDGYWDQIVTFVRGLFNATFKTNSYMERALMTGITRVSKESIFSDLNNLNVVTTTSCEYEDAFGFTEDEVNRALEAFSMEDQKEQVRKWYDGFSFGQRHDIYNPWSITNFLKEKRFDTYWVNTSSNSLIAYELRRGSNAVKQKMEDLLNGKSLTISLDEQIIFSQLEQDENALWSLFLASGYLRVENYEFHSDVMAYVYTLKITNFEVQVMFRRLIAQWFGSVSSNYSSFTRALTQGDLEVLNYELQKILTTTISSFDGGKFADNTAKPERFYHGLVLGLVATENQYIVRSNRESGLGRYDVAMMPKKAGFPGIIMEFKIFDSKREHTLSDTADRALAQIREKDYAEDFVSAGFRRDQILCYGFAFSGKKVLVKKN